MFPSPREILGVNTTYFCVVSGVRGFCTYVGQQWLTIPRAIDLDQILVHYWVLQNTWLQGSTE